MEARLKSAQGCWTPTLLGVPRFLRKSSGVSNPVRVRRLEILLTPPHVHAHWCALYPAVAPTSRRRGSPRTGATDRWVAQPSQSDLGRNVSRGSIPVQVFHQPEPDVERRRLRSRVAACGHTIAMAYGVVAQERSPALHTLAGHAGRVRLFAIGVRPIPAGGPLPHVARQVGEASKGLAPNAPTGDVRR